MVTTIAMSTNGEAISAIVFQKPATGFPNRMESTSDRGMLCLQVSQEIGLTKGMPLTESAVIRRACHCMRAPCRQISACCRGGIC